MKAYAIIYANCIYGVGWEGGGLVGRSQEAEIEQKLSVVSKNLSAIANEDLNLSLAIAQ